ncbi:hypothetical protein M409DRAFT_66744 [Zasmidium cellare ATCC 36951]|uniref:Mediator of RNA polymerase II transcription subunit 11 n=1 Tax=Zasmidium cellare ATCC 36951 TaxID=1080233 RepID=A0A6A6CGI3_ZASCE|nr:uncharacterized protein M409DRAFT_66744 [Zasmidium cellare ATCC 36951]KAF2166275.1 hypothetical protein M409DRAFT_66744 [Zasmidium cellare ATCC 36951]
MAEQTITPAERIRELSAINTDVAVMLTSAGQAINALTNRPARAADGDAQMTDDASSTMDAHKKAFTENTEAYFINVQAVFARLRRQAYALEEAGIIDSDDSALATTVPRSTTGPVEPQARGTPPLAPKQEPVRIVNGGLGKFDVGWLNSRGNKVGEEKEAELIQEAKELLEEVDSLRTSNL